MHYGIIAEYDSIIAKVSSQLTISKMSDSNQSISAPQEFSAMNRHVLTKGVKIAIPIQDIDIMANEKMQTS